MQVTVPIGSTRATVSVPWYASATLALLAVVAGIVMFGDPDMAHNVAPVGILVGDIVAGTIFIRRAMGLDSGERRAWTLVGIGLIIAATGIIVLAIQLAVVGDAPTFGFTDLFFIGGYALVLVGFASLPHTAGHSLQRVRVAFDGIIGAISVGALLWVVVLDRVIVGLEDAPVGDRIFGSMYPLIDLAVVVIIMIVTVRRSSHRFDLRMLLFTGAVLLQAVADVSYLIEGVGQSFTEAEPLFVVYLAAAALFLSTALVVDQVPPPREYADRRLPLWSILAPYSAAAIMVGVLVFRLWDTDLNQGDRILLLATLIVAVLVIGRQGIAIRENRKIVEQQRSDLVSSISHELRTPLTAMVGFVAVLQEDPKLHLDERIEMIDVVAEQGSHLERIVEDLLVLAHDDPSRVGLTTGEHPIAPIVESALRSAGCDMARVTTEVDSDLTAVVDDARLVQILVNLVSNAQRYGGEDCLVVAKADGTRLIIEVHDSGSGVPKKYELTIWERFERGPNRYNASIPGSGIGLAMVRTIAEAHGGRAGYRESERLGGACFSIDLPGIVGKIEPSTMAPSNTIAIG
jgi:signal transduction histidine kinase